MTDDLTEKAKPAGETVWSVPAAGMVPSQAALRREMYVVKGGAVLFAKGKRGEMILSAAVSTSLPRARYVLYGRSLAAESFVAEVKVSLRKADQRKGTAGTPLSSGNGRLVARGVDDTKSVAKSIEIDVGTAFWWVQFQMKLPDTADPQPGKAPFGLLGVGLRRA